MKDRSERVAILFFICTKCRVFYRLFRIDLMVLKVFQGTGSIIKLDLGLLMVNTGLVSRVTLKHGNYVFITGIKIILLTIQYNASIDD